MSALIFCFLATRLLFILADDMDLCHINDYDFTEFTSEFASVSEFVGRYKHDTVAVRVVSIEIEEPHREYVYARCVFRNSSPLNIIDTLYEEFPRRRYVVCGNNSYTRLIAAEAIEPRAIIVTLTRREETTVAITLILGMVCLITLVVVLMVEKT